MTTKETKIPTGSILMGHSHPGCPGVLRANIRVGKGNDSRMVPGLMYCSHESHKGETFDRCLDCGERGVDLTDWFGCVDQDGCEERRASRRTGKVWDDLRAAKEAAREAKEEKAMADRARRATQRTEGEGKVSEGPRKAKAADPLGGRCNHCGAATKGGRFVAGHDAKLKGELMRAAVDGDANAILEMLFRGWLKRPQLLDPGKLELAEQTFQNTNEIEANEWLAKRNEERWS